jgi:DNA-binding NarL/FixJ family response regulator
LTAGQRRVVELKVRGYTTREIAERFHLAMRTVSNHLHAVYQQLGTSDQTELAELLGVRPESGP